MKVRCGALLGFGHMAERGHLPAWRERDDARITAVADADPERRVLAQQLIPDARVYADSGTLLREERIDFVDISTPPAHHAPLIVEAATAGCDILCEKPLATAREAYRMAVDAVQAAGVTLFTVHNWKNSPAFGRVSSLLAEGAIGRLQRVRMESIRDGRSVTVGRGWRGEAAIAGGGILVDHGWHALYLLPALLGENPRRVGAVLEKRRYSDSDVEDTATCTIEFPSVTGEIFLTWAGSERRTRWRLEGERGSIELDERDLRVERDGQTETSELPQSLSAGSHHPDWFDPIIDEFLREVNGEIPRGEHLAAAERCLTLLTLAYESAARGGEPLSVPS